MTIAKQIAYIAAGVLISATLAFSFSVSMSGEQEFACWAYGRGCAE